VARAKRAGARWIALLLGLALVASAVVAYALIKVTAPGPGSDEAVSTVPSTSGSVSTDLVSPADIRKSAGDSSASPGTPPTGTGSGVGDSTLASAPASATPIAPSPTPVTSAPTQSSAAGTAGSDASSGAPPTVTSVLAGSEVSLPAAWSGTATVTVTVLGDCATSTPSVYADVPADLALDLPQNEANAVAPTVTTALPDDEPTLTLGVNASALPSLAVYSSAVDDSGVLHRYWQLELLPGLQRTDVHGTLIDEAVDSTNPNLMVDAETSLQPCETEGTVSLPRVLGVGSTMTGWVSKSSARLTLTARTTDGKREVTVVVTATRKQ